MKKTTHVFAVKTVFIFTFCFIHVSFAFSQKPIDYICTDTSKVIEYETLNGNIELHQYVKSFPFNEYIAHLYSCTRGDYIDTLLVMTSDSILLFASFNYTGRISRNDPDELKVVFPINLEDSLYEHRVNFDMQTFRFEISVYYKPEMTLNSIRFENVIVIDQHNLNDDFHYLTYIAPGVGIIFKGSSKKTEMEIKKIR